LVQWLGLEAKQATWAPQEIFFLNRKLSVGNILKTRLELELQFEDSPEGTTTWEPERHLRCPNLVGPNVLEQYKEKHKLGVYEDCDYGDGRWNARVLPAGRSL
jgi:hypothetical protein